MPVQPGKGSRLAQNLAIVAMYCLSRGKSRHNSMQRSSRQVIKALLPLKLLRTTVKVQNWLYVGCKIIAYAPCILTQVFHLVVEQ